MTYITTKNEQETIALARRFAKKLKGGEIVLLEGELGAGKTTFVKGMAKALGIKQQIKSPTFVLLRSYKNFVHCDAYRINNPQELMQAGLADWLKNKQAIVIIEWGEKVLPIIKKFNPIRIKFKHGKTKNERIIEL